MRIGKFKGTYFIRVLFFLLFIFMFLNLEPEGAADFLHDLRELHHLLAALLKLRRRREGPQDVDADLDRHFVLRGPLRDDSDAAGQCLGQNINAALALQLLRVEGRALKERGRKMKKREKRIRN